MMINIHIFGSWCNNYFDGVMTTNVANSIAAHGHKVTVFHHTKNFDKKHENVSLVKGLPTGGDILIIQYEDVIGFTSKFSIDQFKNNYKKVFYHVSQCSGWNNNKNHQFLVDKILNKLDNMICALNWDTKKASSEGFNAKFGGRGANPIILKTTCKTIQPTVFLDYERGSTHCKHKDFISALEIVKKKNPKVRVGTFIKKYPVSDFAARWGDFKYMADAIYNPCWIFLPSHNGGYELPIVEAQMSGCTICSFKDHVQEEILSPASKKYVSNSISELASNILKAIDNFELEKINNRFFAYTSHRWDKIAKNWINIVS